MPAAPTIQTRSFPRSDWCARPGDAVAEERLRLGEGEALLLAGELERDFRLSSESPSRITRPFFIENDRSL